MISFIYFDVGGVCIHDFSGNDNWQKLREELGIKAQDDGAFQQIWQTYCTELNTTRNVQTIIPILEAKFGITIPADYSLLDGFVKRFAKNPLIWPIIDEIQHSIRRGLLTNMYPDMLAAIQQRKLLPPANWEVIVDSSIEHLEKPDFKFFELAEKRAQANHNEILFIDNSPRHIKAAQEYGWQTFLYNSSDNESACRDLHNYLKDQNLLIHSKNKK